MYRYRIEILDTDEATAQGDLGRIWERFDDWKSFMAGEPDAQRESCSMQLTGKIFMTLAILVFTVVPPIVDLGTTSHVFHPEWTPHARVHTVWLLGLASAVGLLAIYLLWIRQRDAGFNLNLAFALGLCTYGAFFLAAATRGLYDGAMTDAGGLQSGPFGFDPNTFTFTIATTVLIAGWLLGRRPGSSHRGGVS